MSATKFPGLRWKSCECPDCEGVGCKECDGIGSRLFPTVRARGASWRYVLLPRHTDYAEAVELLKKQDMAKILRGFKR